MSKYTAKPLPPVDLPELRQVGKPLRRVDALGKAVGATVYAGDYTMPNMLHAKVFRSSEPSAKITKLDVSLIAAAAFGSYALRQTGIAHPPIIVPAR